MNNLKIDINENHITNLDDFVNNIKNVDIESKPELEDYLENLLALFTYNPNYHNIDASEIQKIVSSIKKVLFKNYINKNDVMGNIDTLTKIKDVDNRFSNYQIITVTNKLDIDVDYLVNESDIVELPTNDSLFMFIKNNYKKVFTEEVNISEELVKFFSSYNLEYPIINHDFKKEENAIIDFIKKFNIKGQVKVFKTNYNDHFYIVNDNILEAKENDGDYQVNVLKQGKQDENNKIVEGDKVFLYDEIKTININSIDTEELGDLINSDTIYDEPMSNDNRLKLYVYIKSILELIYSSQDINKNCYDLFMIYISNISKKDSLSLIESDFLSYYNDILTNEEGKSRSLTNRKKITIEGGLAAVAIILELAIIGMFVLTFLSLDI